jgi:hypothetical protein
MELLCSVTSRCVYEWMLRTESPAVEGLDDSDAMNEHPEKNH